MKLRWLALGSLIAHGARVAAEDAPDKSRYHLFNPVPREHMRELSTDRPDTTESPFTVDAGHFQVEADLVRFTYDRRTPGRDRSVTEAWEFAAFNLKAGLWNNVDVQVIVPTYATVRVRDRQTGQRQTVNGFGDMEVRTKINLRGNDGGPFALGVMPFVKIPTACGDLGNNAVEGGVILPFAVELPADWGLVSMAQVDLNEDEDGSGYHPVFVNTVGFSHDIVGPLGGYVEFISVASGDTDARWMGYLGAGVTYGLTGDIQLDAGMNFGLNKAADDYQPFLGLSWRF